MDAKELIDALEPQAAEHGLELVDIELINPGKAPTVRIYLDATGGITFDTIVDAQSWIDAYLEELDPFPGAYTLEVSSPGIDRHLRTKEHFCRFAGERAQITTSGIPGKSKWTGTLQGMEDDDVLLLVDEEQVRLPFNNIRKAHVIGVVDFSKGKES